MALSGPDSLELLAITDRNVIGMGSLLAAGREALAGGLPALMLREKDLPEETLLPIAESLREATARTGARLIINRRLGLARSVGADGVHLGADGPTADEARRMLGPAAVLGYSAHAVDEALDAFAAGFDYVLLSPIYRTPGKDGLLKPIGPAPLAQLSRRAPGPVLALGGVGLANLAEVAAGGASGIAVVRAVFGARSPREATAELLEAWRSARLAAARQG
jgi:thiamine-phosphate pyrophosphorylase